MICVVVVEEVLMLLYKQDLCLIWYCYCEEGCGLLKFTHRGDDQAICYDGEDMFVVVCSLIFLG